MRISKQIDENDCMEKAYKLGHAYVNGKNIIILFKRRDKRYD